MKYLALLQVMIFEMLDEIEKIFIDHSFIITEKRQKKRNVLMV
jgi:hypothetical protein